MPTRFITTYLPSRHGFRFANDFRHGLGDADVTWGLCNGMSWTSLDYFNAGRDAPAIADVDFAAGRVSIRSGPGAATDDGATVQLFTMRTVCNEVLVCGKTVTGTGFSNWGGCACGNGPDAPAAACWGPGRTDLVVRGGDDQLWHCGVDGPPLAGLRRGCHTGLPGFAALGGRTRHPPALAAPFANRLELYFVDDDGQLQFRVHDGGWQPWSSLGRPEGLRLDTGPAAVSHFGHMAGYVRATDRQCWELAWEHGRWQPWRPIGGQFTSGLAAATPAPGRTEVYGRGLDGAVWINIFDGGAWNGWASLGAPAVGTTTDAPAAVSRVGFMDVYVRGNDGGIWHRRWSGGGWQDWTSVETPVSADSRRLTDAIYWRNSHSTTEPIALAIASLGLGLLFGGGEAWSKFVNWRPRSDEDCFHWSSTDELRKLVGFLQRGRPIPLGLLAYEGTGHEVVAYGIDSDATVDPASHDFPAGSAWRVRVYDPKYPGCDDITITLDPASTTRWRDTTRINRIRSSTGEMWRGCFVRDDYRAETPPV